MMFKYIVMNFSSSEKMRIVSSHLIYYFDRSHLGSTAIAIFLE